jgi:hypothetical protein
VSRNRAPRVVLAVGILAGVVHAATFPTLNPAQVGIATDVYFHAARTALAGGDLYTVTPPAHPRFSFRYPPLVVLAFVPHALLGSEGAAYLLQTAVNVASVAALGTLAVRFLDRAAVPFTRTDRVLVVGYTALSIPMVSNLVMGQVNVQLALAVAAAAVWLERDRPAASGAALGLAAAVKLFPALVGAWLLRRRAWRAIGAATVAGVSVVLGGLALFGPGASEAFLTEVVGGEVRTTGPSAGSPYLTVRRYLTALAPNLPAAWLLPAGIIVLAPVVAGVNWTVRTPAARVTGLLGTVLAALVLLPLEPFYLAIAVFPLVAALYLVEPGAPRRVLLPGALLLSVPVSYGGVGAALRSVLPPGVEAPLTDAVEAVLNTVLPPMVGVVLVFAAGLLVQYRVVAGDAENRR